jgi:hypothetical protein
MKRVTLIATALVLAVFAVLAGGSAAQETNVSERTFLTFSDTVEMPGLTLQPGTYVFKLADTPSRNVVHVWNETEDQMLGHWLFVQAERPEVTGENVVMFREAPAGTPPAVQYWYFPGEKIGKEFIYPKDQALRIAEATGSTVLTDEGIEISPADAQARTGDDTQVQAEADVRAPSDDAIADSDDAVIADVDTRADAAVQDRSAQQPVGTSGVQADSQVARADELPRTASPLALAGLLGLLSLAGAMGLRAYRR